ncbi:MAG: cupin domain-containing protein [Dehalococcoidia bacterium]
MTGAPMGDYTVISDTRTAETSLRLLRLAPGQEIRPHFHTAATQVYVVLSGSVRIRLGDGTLESRPLDTVQVPPRLVHGLEANEPSVVLSITVPPLDPEDQHPAGPGEPSYGK